MDSAVSAKRGVRDHVSAVLAIGGILSVFILLNFPFRYDWVYIDGTLIYRVENGAITHPAKPIEDQAPAVQAGWPMRYLQSRTFPDGSAQQRWLWWGLTVDFSLAVLGIGLVVWGALKKFSNASTKVKSQLSVKDMLIVILVLAIPLTYYSQQRSRSSADEQLAIELNREGRCVREAEVPRIFVKYIPKPLLMAWARITQVKINNPQTTQVEQVVELPYLRVLQIGGGDYDLRYLDSLPSQFHLSDLHVTGRPLDGRTIQMISHCEGVRDLSLARTDIGPAGIQLLGKLTQLRTLFLDGCPFPLAEFGNPDFRDTLEQLVLPRPNSGTGDSLHLIDWPQLVQLEVVGLDQYSNSTPVSLTLENMPKLKTLELDELQKFDLKLYNLERLVRLVSRNYERIQRLASGSTVPGGLWLEGITLENIPDITKLELYGTDLLRFETKFQDLDFLGIGCFRLNVARQAIYDTDISLETRQGWIDQIGKNPNGPIELDIAALPLPGVKLHPLASNDKIKTIQLSDTNMTLAQLRGLSGMKGLQTLNIQRNRLNYQKVNTLISILPQLRNLQVDSTMVDRLKIENHANLRTLNLDQYAFPTIEALHLVDLPQFTSAVTVGPNCIYLHVESAPKMSGLGFVSPLPRRTEIQGTGGLQWFVAGGEHLTTPIVKEVLANESMRHLVLAYPSVGTDDLKAVSQLSKLQALCLPGCPIDDELFLSLKNIKHLKQLDLSDTPITSKIVSQLVNSKQLEKLALAYTPLTSADVSALTTLGDLKHLDLSGIELQQEAMTKIANLVNLEELLLADAKLDITPLGNLQSGQLSSLRLVDLSNSTVDWASVRKLAELRPRVRFRLSPVTAPADLLVRLEASKQLDIEEEGWGWQVNESAARLTQFEPPTLDLRRFRRVGSSATP